MENEAAELFEQIVDPPSHIVRLRLMKDLRAMRYNASQQLHQQQAHPLPGVLEPYDTEIRDVMFEGPHLVKTIRHRLWLQDQPAAFRYKEATRSINTSSGKFPGCAFSPVGRARVWWREEFPRERTPAQAWLNPFAARERGHTDGLRSTDASLAICPQQFANNDARVSPEVSMRPGAASPGRSPSPRSVSPRDVLSTTSPLEQQSAEAERDPWQFAMEVLSLPLPSALTIVREHEQVRDEGQEVFMREYELMDDCLFPKDDHTMVAALAKSQRSRMPIAQRPPNVSVEEHLLQLRQQEDEQLEKLADPNFTEKSDQMVGVRGSVFQGKEATFDLMTSSDESGNEGEAMEAATAPAEQLTLSRQLTLAAVVIFLLLYPTLIEKCLLMMQCDDVDYGPPSPAYPEGGVRSLLFSDRSIDCDTGEHSQYTIAALTAGLGYGIGIPLFVTAYISYLHRTQGQEYALTAFSFSRLVTMLVPGGGRV